MRAAPAYIVEPAKDRFRPAPRQLFVKYAETRVVTRLTEAIWQQRRALKLAERRW
jgi:hypothetical protein